MHFSCLNELLWFAFMDLINCMALPIIVPSLKGALLCPNWAEFCCQICILAPGKAIITPHEAQYQEKGCVETQRLI